MNTTIKTAKNLNKLTKIALTLFNKAPEVGHTVSFAEVNQKALTRGYVVHPSVCNSAVLNWLDSTMVDYNSTFYKNWNDIISKSRFELAIDQLKHYASTYGTNFTGEVYLPEGSIELPELKNIKVITPISDDEFISRVEKLLFSGVALKQETIDDLLYVLDFYEYNIDVEKVKNKEAKMYLFKRTNTLPSDATEMVRFLVYLATDKTLLIKDKSTINTIKASRIDLLPYVEEFGLEKLSSVFYRFKRIFLAFKNVNLNNRATVNRLRRAAKNNHVPMVRPSVEMLLSGDFDLIKTKKVVEKLTNYKKVSLLQTILVRKKELSTRVFLVRNQKVFILEEKAKFDLKRLDSIYAIVYQSLVESISAKKSEIQLPTGVTLTLPTSEKSFIGNYPLGTSFNFGEDDAIVGINWKDVDGARDLDLSLIDLHNMKIGWNSNYTNSDKSLIYSGDMTSANPEATELIYAKKGFNPSIVKVNLFSGSVNSKFKFFIAKEAIKNVSRNYMVNPDNVLFTVDCQMDSNEKSFGVITGDKFILAQFRTGNRSVSGFDSTNKYTQYALDTLDCYVNLENVLTDAGFTVTYSKDAVLDKDTLIDLLS